MASPPPRPEIDGVDVVGQLGDDRGEVLGAERHPEAFGDLPAELAIFEREAEELRVGEGVVFGERRDLAVFLGVVDVVADAHHPLRAVRVEAEEILRRRHIGGFQRAGRAVHERRLRLGLGIVADRDAFRSGHRAEQDVDFVLLDQLAGAANCRIRARVGRENDGLDRLAAGLVAGLLEGDLKSAQRIFTERGQRAFERGEHADLDLVLRLRGARSERYADRRRHQQLSPHELPPLRLLDSSQFITSGIRSCAIIHKQSA